MDRIVVRTLMWIYVLDPSRGRSVQGSEQKHERVELTCHMGQLSPIQKSTGNSKHALDIKIHQRPHILRTSQTPGRIQKVDPP